ncbi:4'-phosphopantetheinyl transferase family protein [Microtetraspora niveoalba]|uniref:4'-phosphopantetheinyl transferase family protein n=1 Tax=Microtetraspora niveoalba TaxID=46175 RepID=UPI0008303547|nr:4'-phosphopantetheinyl transferase superfamily protein [Microtetraspora niveoalba]
MIELILPPYVVAADTCEEFLDGALFPEEEAIISRSVDKRRREFTTARVCARDALRMLGRPATAILPGVRGEPLWPDGIAGSITHCAGYRGAVLGTRSEVVAIGIDAEQNAPLPNGVLAAIGLAEERRLVRELLREHPSIRWDRLLFSTKESVYKAWFPLVNRWLSFEDALIDIDPLRGVFSAQLLVTGPRVNGQRMDVFSGRWLVQNGLILTAIVIPAVMPAAPAMSGRSGYSGG